MRVDIFTSEDRAREVYARYRAQESGKYHFWTLAGAFVTSYLFTLAMSFIFNSFLYPDVRDIYRTNPQYFIMGIFFNGRPFILIVVIFLLLWSLTRFASARIAFRILTLYQGVFYGALAGVGGYLLTLLIFAILKLGDAGILPLILAGIGFVIVLAIGLKGRFLPGKGL
jgi:hypothetical protein